MSMRLTFSDTFYMISFTDAAFKEVTNTRERIKLKREFKTGRPYMKREFKRKADAEKAYNKMSDADRKLCYVAEMFNIGF